MSAPETLSGPAAGTPDLPGDVTTLPVGGDWVALPSAGAILVEDPSLERPIGSVPAVTAEGVDRAVRAAHAAAPGWAAWPADARAGVLERIADGLEADAEALALLVAREVGTPVAIAAAVQVALPVAVLRRAAGEARALVQDEPAGAARVSYEPAGVVAAITPWNFPLHQIAAKVGFALAAGCAVVLKPSEVAPFNALALAGIAARAGLPPGVLNVVTGTGPEAGEALVGHPLVDVVSLTGSVGAGRRVGAIAGDALKRVALELGGKSASVVLEDADLERAVRHGIGRGFLNSGQACNAATRILVPRDRLAEAEEIAADETGRLVVGPALDAATTMGPVVSATRWAETRRRRRQGLDVSADDLVRKALFGADDGDTLRRLEYDPDLHHLALALPPTLDEAEVARLVSRARLHLRARSVTMRHDGGWVVWLGSDGAPESAAIEEVERLMDQEEAVGRSEVSPGIAGFRLVHREALDARRVGVLRGGSGLTRHRDVALLAVLCADSARARALARAELGPLAVDDEVTERLRETLTAYLAHGESHVAAAQELFVHQKTVSYRVRQAEQLLGRKVSERRVELEAALLVHRAFNGDV
ncbi:aldehyde dehydrogenase family protein [Patulibacter brassicae]|uniref:aldehyde dehydrogenase (NAD(+)) n=1 Tax=Patulibacter brassicae TaxID=1705717 RepID=A0ABU4VJA9_9ACTN|nr:aldehyde dehydrogenase family protein [Patulibacter brassicae]MDX8151888.1 aldehyde dehydrogenase family protein [Patulibacter brassicae]